MADFVDRFGACLAFVEAIREVVDEGRDGARVLVPMHDAGRNDVISKSDSANNALMVCCPASDFKSIVT